MRDCLASLSTRREIRGGETRRRRLGKQAKDLLIESPPEEDFGPQNMKPPVPLLVLRSELCFRTGNVLKSRVEFPALKFKPDFGI